MNINHLLNIGGKYLGKYIEYKTHSGEDGIGIVHGVFYSPQHNQVLWSISTAHSIEVYTQDYMLGTGYYSNIGPSAFISEELCLN